MFCRECGHVMDNKARVCANCGLQQQGLMKKEDITIEKVEIPNYNPELKKFGNDMLAGFKSGLKGLQGMFGK